MFVIIWVKIKIFKKIDVNFFLFIVNFMLLNDILIFEIGWFDLVFVFKLLFFVLLCGWLWFECWGLEEGDDVLEKVGCLFLWRDDGLRDNLWCSVIMWWVWLLDCLYWCVSVIVFIDMFYIGCGYEEKNMNWIV